MKKRFRVITTVLVFALCVCAVPNSLHAKAADSMDVKVNKDDIVVLHTNDSHGRVDDNMGFSSVAALKQYYEKLGAEVILIDAGDTLHGLPFATVERGLSVVDVMNQVGYDVMVPGNHDFNYGSQRLLELREAMKFELVAANVIVKDTNETYLNGYTIMERDGKKIGIFGLATPETTYKTNPNNVSGLEFKDPVTVASEMVKLLQSKEVDCIIAVSHLGTDGSSEYTSELVAKKVKGIDVIIDGHSHTAYEHGYKVKDTLIASTGEYITNIGSVVIDGDKITAELVTPEEFSAKDATIDSFIAGIKERQNVILSEVVGKTGVNLDGERETNRTQSTNLGNLTTDAMLLATGAEVALTNGGGIRSSIAKGDITKNNLVTVFPFGNYVVTKKVTGADILAALENGVAGYPETSGAFPQVAGLTFNFDASKTVGSRVTNVLINGKKLDKKASYTLATNDFIANGGDQYTMLATQPIVNEFASLEEVVREYLQKNEVGSMSTEKRAVETSKIKISTETTKTVTKSAETTSAETTSAETTSKDTISTDETSENSSTYVVMNGDYLKKISKKLLGNESLWESIYDANKDVIKNPDVIYPGMTLVVPATK